MVHQIGTYIGVVQEAPSHGTRKKKNARVLEEVG